MRSFFIIFIISFSFTSSRAQQFFGIDYEISVPQGDMKEFTGNTSFAGIGAMGRVTITENITIGLKGAWNNFIETRSDPLYYNGEWYYGKQERSLYVLSFMFNSHYYFNLSHDLQIYAGMNIGTDYIVQKFKIDSEMLLSNKLHLSLAPDIGIKKYMYSGMSAIAGIRYHHAFARKETTAFDYWNFYVGIVLKSSLL